jgi:hypothetical protein
MDLLKRDRRGIAVISMAILGALIAFFNITFPGASAAADNSSHRPVSSQWALRQPFRLRVSVNPGVTKETNFPVGVQIDFREIYRDNDLPGRVDPNSIRVVRYNSQTGQMLPYRDQPGQFEIPYFLSGDFPNDDAGTVWWRIKNDTDMHFYVFFDSMNPAKPYAPPQTMGPVGVGDNLYYNDGKPGFAGNIALHSTYWSIDWDGDNLKDLIGFGYRIYEPGMPLERDLGNWIYFYKNIGTAKAPMFAPRYRLKDEDGKYFTTKNIGMNMYPGDWDGDGDTDFFGYDNKSLLLFENTGKRDRNNLFIMKPARPVGTLNNASEFRKTLPTMVGKGLRFSFRGGKLADWEGDGDQDLILDFRKTERIGEVNPRRGIFPYGVSLMLFEVWKNEGKGPDGNPIFGTPEIIREERGMPINAFTTAAGGAEYIDYDSDGDLDLLYHDDTTRPLEGGRLMFSENVGTRKAPLLMKGFDILRTYTSKPQFVDWNNDGRFDLVAGGEFFENVNPESGKPEGVKENTTPLGTYIPQPRKLPKFVSRGLAQTPNPKIMTYFTDAADWDGDGDLDLISGFQSHLNVLINKGTNLDPVFARPVQLEAGGKPVYMPNWIDPQSDEPSRWGPQGPSEPDYGWLVPTVHDFDNDGDLDIFVTGQRWQVKYFENIGTKQKARLAAGREVRFQGNPHEFSWRSRVSAGDVDGDGRAEFVVTSHQDNVFYTYRPGKTQKDPAVLEVERGAALLQEDGTNMQGWYGTQNNNGDNHSQLVDWDADGDLDLLNGSIWAVWYYENVGTKTKPSFRNRGRMTAAGETLHTFNHAGSFDAADWNGDGRMDLLTSTECPSDQPLGAVLHLFDRSYLDGAYLFARVQGFEKKS